MGRSIEGHCSEGRTIEEDTLRWSGVPLAIAEALASSAVVIALFWKSSNSHRSWSKGISMVLLSIVRGIRWIRHLNIAGRTEVNIGGTGLYLRLAFLLK